MYSLNGAKIICRTRVPFTGKYKKKRSNSRETPPDSKETACYPQEKVKPIQQRKAEHGTEQPTNNVGSRGQRRSLVVKQQETLEEKCLARAKMKERRRSKIFASVLQVHGELKS